MNEPDTIAVNVEVERKVYAARADLDVEIRGDSFVSGSAALRKAREVRDLIAALAEVGIAESGVQVLGITAEVSSGLITKTSSAVYRLRIEVPSLDILADALGAVTSRKNASLTRLEWQYPGLEELHDEMLGEALRRAEQRAALICRELRHLNLGIHSLTEKIRDKEDRQARLVVSTMRAPAGLNPTAALTAKDLGLDVTHAKTVALDVRVEYRVTPEAEAGKPATRGG
jgi:uncharacterized protein YggE